MIFVETKLAGAYIIEPEKLEDERGFFARTWCEHEFKSQGISNRMTQCSISFNKNKRTLRGMHYQAAPHVETKLVRCTMGAIFDVIIDLRPDSKTYKKWISVELSAVNRCMLYIPGNMAHGFQTLVNSTEVIYQMDECYHPESSRRIRWNDPEFGINWPFLDPVLSEEDRNAINYH